MVMAEVGGSLQSPPAPPFLGAAGRVRGQGGVLRGWRARTQGRPGSSLQWGPSCCLETLNLLLGGLVGEQHLHSVADPLGMHQAVGVVKAQDVCKDGEVSKQSEPGTSAHPVPLGVGRPELWVGLEGLPQPITPDYLPGRCLCQPKE